MQGKRWSKDEHERLGIAVVAAILDGKTVVQGCQNFVDENPTRTLSAAKLNWHTHARELVREDYEAARAGNAQTAATSTKPSQTPVADKFVSTLMRIQENRVVTKADLIRVLRGAEFHTDDSFLVSKLQAELKHAQRALQTLQNEHTLLKAQYEEVSLERDQMITAFNIARRSFAGVEFAPPKSVVVGADSVVERVHTEESA